MSVYETVEGMSLRGFLTRSAKDLSSINLASTSVFGPTRIAKGRETFFPINSMPCLAEDLTL